MNSRKIINKNRESWSKRHSQDRVPLTSCNPVKPNYRPKDVLKEDRRLINWKQWLDDRQRRQDYLAEALKREPYELALNAHERVRTKYETQCFVDAAKRSEATNMGRYRGNPIFWVVPERLVEICDDAADSEPVFDNLDVLSNEPPEVTRVALPKLILKEKKLLGPYLDSSKVNLSSKWESGDYLRKRTTQLKGELQNLEHKNPEMENLIVIGKKFECGDKENFLRTPVITITQDETKKPLLYNPEQRIILKIQEREFVLEKENHFERLSRKETSRLKECEDDLNNKKYAFSAFENDRLYRIISKNAKPITWSLYFETSRDELCKRKLVLENKGIQIIKIEWRNVTSKFLPISIPDRFDSCFFFNKNSFCIPPGQKIEIPIWFKSDRPTVATETWILLVTPKIYPAALNLRLWATSSGECWKFRNVNNSNNVKECLKRRIRDSTVREILEEIFLISTSDQFINDISYDLFFLESDVFRVRNPSYYYHSALVNELKIMYEDSTAEEEDDTEQWNLSLEDMRSHLLAIGDPYVRRKKLIRFQEICDWCLQPNSFYERPACSKQKLVYWLLCSLFNTFEDESDFIMKTCCADCLEDVGEEDAQEFEDRKSEILINCKTITVYHEVFFIRIYCLLSETIDRICAAVDSQDYYNKD